jgi:hypothetical protein
MLPIAYAFALELQASLALLGNLSGICVTSQAPVFEAADVEFIII